MHRLSKVDIDDSNLPPPTPEIEQERRVAIFDLLEDNTFRIPLREGKEIPDAKNTPYGCSVKYAG